MVTSKGYFVETCENARGGIIFESRPHIPKPWTVVNAEGYDKPVVYPHCWLRPLKDPDAEQLTEETEEVVA